MTTNIAASVQQLYVAYFSRPADAAGLSYWQQLIKNGLSLESVGDAFAKSKEFQENYGTLKAEEVVNKVYMNLFGRSAESGGLKFWADLLSNGTLTVNNIVTAVSGGAQGTDKLAFSNKVTAADLFTSAMDTNVELIGYTGTNANLIAKYYLSTVTDNASLDIFKANVGEVVFRATDPSHVANPGIAVGEPYPIKGIAVGEPNPGKPNGVAVGEPNPNTPTNGVAVGEPSPNKGLAVGEPHPNTSQADIGIKLVGNADLPDAHFFF